jgi:hypothetical protein
MKRTVLKSLLLLSALASVGCAVIMLSSPSEPDKDLLSLAKYRQWNLVNPTPQLMQPQAAEDCAIIFGRDKSSPHLNKYISVYVNPVGREAMMGKRDSKFPAGSMIVKEKLGKPDSKKPEMLTAMIKREAGYNPETGDWEFLVLDGQAIAILERGKLERCSGCHKSYTYSDFVTKTYVRPGE